MAKKKQPKRLSSVPKRAKRLRAGDPDSFEWQDELAEFFQDRANYVKAYGARIGDFLELSPMPLVYGWTREEIPNTGRESLMTRQERATRKGRIVERRRAVARKLAAQEAKKAEAKAEA